MITKEEIIKILESYVIEGYRRERIIDEISIDDIAEEVVKKCSMPSVVGQSEQLVCDCELPTSEFELNTGEILCCKCEKPKAN